MNVEDAQKQLGETAIKFRVHWESLRAGWNDEASAAFEREHIQAISDILGSADAALQELNVAVSRARRSLTGRRGSY